MGKLIKLGVGIGWLAVVCAGLGLLAEYQSTPGTAAEPAKNWPAETSLVRPADRCFLLVFVHPKCPCSDATVSELARLMADCQGKLAATVVFVKPPGTGPDWEKTGLYRSAAAVPGVSVVTDDSGVEAQRFDASTSGQTMLYGPSGKLLFSGGITAGRGHEGDNAGEDAIADLVNGKNTGTCSTPVFGCGLFDPMSSTRGSTCQR